MKCIDRFVCAKMSILKRMTLQLQSSKTVNDFCENNIFDLITRKRFRNTKEIKFNRKCESESKIKVVAKHKYLTNELIKVDLCNQFFNLTLNY